MGFCGGVTPVLGFCQPGQRLIPILLTPLQPLQMSMTAYATYSVSGIPLLCCGPLCVACGVQITTVDEAKTFYPLFGLGANVALIFSGRAVKYFSQVRSQSLRHKQGQFGPVRLFVKPH